MPRYYPRGLANYGGGIGRPPGRRTADDRLGDYLASRYQPAESRDYGLFTEDVRAGDEGRRQRLALTELGGELDDPSVTEGVAYPEGPLHWAGRNTLGRLGVGDWQAPEGEPADERLARLIGEQRGSEAKRERALQAAKILTEFADDLDPEGRAMLGDQLGAAYREAGVDVPNEAFAHVREKAPSSQFEAFRRGGPDRAAAEEWQRLQDRPQPRQESADEAQMRRLAEIFERRGKSPDKAFLAALRYARGARGRTPTRADEEVETLVSEGMAAGLSRGDAIISARGRLRRTGGAQDWDFEEPGPREGTAGPADSGDFFEQLRRASEGR